MIQSLTRVHVLLQQHKYDLAEQELRGALASDPNLAEAHALLSLCLDKRESYDEATREAQAAIHLSPDAPLGHYALAAVMYDRHRYDEAKQAIEEAIRLDPYNESFFAILSSVHLAQRHWQEALDAAEQGLAIDAEDVECNSLRTLALEKLGRGEHALATSTETLRRDPDNPTAHAVQGWTLLNAGDYRRAQEHFREALRLDPNNEFARGGMINALNARNPIFRLIYRFYSAMARLSTGAQWAVIIGLLVGVRVLRGIGRQVPEFQPFVVPVIVLYFLFVLLTWIANPLFNTVLRFNRFGRYLLRRDQIWASNLIAGSLVLAALSAVTLGLLGAWPLGLLAAGYFVLLLLPISGTFQCSTGWPRWTMAGISTLLAVIGFAGFVLLFIDPATAQSAGILFVIGVFLSQFIANGLAAVEPTK